MSTQAQIKANRENAQHSTGPQTGQGKQTSAQNARKHGLSGLTLFVHPDRRDEFVELYDLYYNEIRPVGEIQTEYFERLIHSKWNAYLAREFHVQATLEQDEKKLASATRYLAHWERAYDKALKALRDLQADLALRAIPQNEPIADLPLCCPVRQVANEATRLARLQERTQWTEARHAILAAIGQAFRPENPPTQAQEHLDQAA